MGRYRARAVELHVRLRPAFPRRRFVAPAPSIIGADSLPAGFQSAQVRGATLGSAAPALPARTRIAAEQACGDVRGTVLAASQPRAVRLAARAPPAGLAARCPYLRCAHLRRCRNGRGDPRRTRALPRHGRTADRVCARLVGGVDRRRFLGQGRRGSTATRTARHSRDRPRDRRRTFPLRFPKACRRFLMFLTRRYSRAGLRSCIKAVSARSRKRCGPASRR